MGSIVAPTTEPLAQVMHESFKLGGIGLAKFWRSHSNSLTRRSCVSGSARLEMHQSIMASRRAMAC